MPNWPTKEQAERLKELGLEWKPQYGDYYAVYSIPDMPDATVFSLPILIKSSDELDWVTQTQDWHLWLPRLDQIMAEIRSHPNVLRITFFDGGCTISAYLPIGKNAAALKTYMGEGPNDTQAAAKALILFKEASCEVPRL